MWCNHAVVLTLLQLRRISTSFYQGSDFNIVDNLLIAAQGLPMRMLIVLSVDEIFLPRHVQMKTLLLQFLTNDNNNQSCFLLEVIG